MTKRKKMSDIEEFIVLPDSEKERIFQELEAETPEETLARSRPLNARERRQWRKFKAKAKMGRPKIGKGAKIVPFGQGVSELGKVLDELKRQKFNGTITCEYERLSPKLEEEIGECVKWYNAYFSK